jgi:ATP-binding cassette, subfamily B, bacterial
MSQLGTGLAAYAEAQKKRGQKIHDNTPRRIVQSFRPYAGKVILLLLVIILVTALNLVLPLLIPFVFDDALKNHNMGRLLFYLALMTGSTLAGGLISVYQTYLSNITGQYVMRDLRKELYSHLQDMEFHFFTSTRTGEIQSRLSNDVSGAQSAVTDTFAAALTSLITVIGTVFGMFYINPILALASFALTPLFVWMASKIGKIRRQTRRATQNSLASLTALMLETLSVSGVLLIKTFGRKGFAKGKFEQENQRLTELGIHQQMVGRWSLMFMNTFFQLTPVIVCLFAGFIIIYLPHVTTITIGGIIAFLTLQSRFFGPLNQLLGLQVNLQGALALFDRLFEYLDLPARIKDAPDALHLLPEDVRGEVAMQNVVFSYRNSDFSPPADLFAIDSIKQADGEKAKSAALLTLEAPVEQHSTLNNISFIASQGQLVALVGPSGAGKTTITHLISRLYDVESGSVELDGHNVKNIALESLGNLIGVVTQETYLFHASIRENLLYVQPDATDEEIINAAKAAAIHDRIMELEHGYETFVGERGYKLSGGEKQRLAIARVLLKKPRVLILDEATSSLDTNSERLIQAALKLLTKDRTTIAIAHRLSTILAADLILVIDRGEVVERGTHQELLEYNGLYARLYHGQFA